MKKKNGSPAACIFNAEQLKSLSSSNIPKHVAIIPDGNRRWAKKQNNSIVDGHRQGGKTLMEIVRASKEMGIEIITFYTFSTENWSRPMTEVKAFFQLLKTFLKEHCQEMIDNGVRFNIIGDPRQLSKSMNAILKNVQDATEACSDIDLVLAINYGARDEIRRAVTTMIDDYDKKKLKKEAITEKAISKYLDTSRWPDPDLCIRTSGESRLSNFLLWQTCYSEICIVDELWPDFTPKHLYKAVIDYQKRSRRWGGGT